MLIIMRNVSQFTHFGIHVYILTFLPTKILILMVLELRIICFRVTSLSTVLKLVLQSILAFGSDIPDKER